MILFNKINFLKLKLDKVLNARKPPNWASNLSIYKSAFGNEDLIVWMRTAAFPTFKKLYGRILVEENSKLADKILENNRTSRLNKIREQLYQKFNDTTIFGLETIVKPTTKYRLPRGQYYVEIDYSNLF